MKILARSFRALVLHKTASLIIGLLPITALALKFGLFAFLAGLVHWIVIYARLPFETKELEVTAEELVTTTFNGYTRRWRLDQLTRVVPVKAGAVLEFESGEPLRFQTSKESAAVFARHLITQLKLVPSEKSFLRAQSFVPSTTSDLRGPDSLTCPACLRKRPSKYWFQTPPDGASSEVCIDCQAPANRIVAAS